MLLTLRHQLHELMEANDELQKLAAVAAMRGILCMDGETEMDEPSVRAAALRFLRAQWIVDRCTQLLGDLTGGIAEEVVASQVPGTEGAERDFAQWIGWMQEHHPGLGER